MNAKPLLQQQPVTTQGHQPSVELVEVIQILARMVNQQQAEIAALKTRLTAAGIP